jgi:hypothetical protein
MRAPRVFASRRYFIATGWSLAGFEPRNTITSDSNQSL